METDELLIEVDDYTQIADWFVTHPGHRSVTVEHRGLDYRERWHCDQPRHAWNRVFAGMYREV